MANKATSLKELIEAEKFDEALSSLSTIERTRRLTIQEMVFKGRCIQLSSGVGTPPLSEAEHSFLDALKQDGDYVPALLELGWFYYAVEDEAKMALPLFEQAVAISLKNLRESVKGKRDCLEEASNDLTKRWKPNFGVSFMQVKSGRSARRLLLALSDLFASPILDADDCLVISREADVFRHAVSFPSDPVEFEAFVNHVHLDDVLAFSAGKLSRKDLFRIGELVIQVWSDRLQVLLRGREVLFYLGGSRGVTLRFHVVREEFVNWLDLQDRRFIQKEKMQIFRLNADGLSEEPKA